MTPRATAVLVTYNSAADIGAALDGLRPLIETGTVECVVVDNASADRTLEVVRAHAGVEVVALPVNVGYGRGLNAGLERAHAPYVLFMNADTVLTRENLERLCAFMDDRPRAGMAAPAIVDEAGGLQVAGRSPTPWVLMARAAGLGRFAGRQRPIEPGKPPFETDWLLGALLIARTSLMRELGGFDPRFFLYFEETDLCRRVLRSGHELWAVGEAVATHVGSVSAKGTGLPLFGDCIAEHYFRSRYYYLRKHFGVAAASATEAVEWATLVLRSWLSGRSGRDGLAARRKGPFFTLPAEVVAGPRAGAR
jgi:GT2 family glycosyltransferase